MCWCSAGIIIMKHALSLFLHTLCPFSLSSLFLFNPAFIYFQITIYSICCLIVICPVLFLTTPYYLILSNLAFFPLLSHLFSTLSRGAGVIRATSVLSQRTASSGEGTLRTGLCPGCRAPICPPLWPSQCTYPTPAPPGRAGSRDTKVHKLNSSSTKGLCI